MKRVTLRFIVPNIIQILFLSAGIGVAFLVANNTALRNSDIESFGVFSLFIVAFSLYFLSMSMVMYWHNSKIIKDNNSNFVKENIISMLGVGVLPCILLIVLSSMLFGDGFFSELVPLRWMLIPAVLMLNMLMGTLFAKIYASERVTDFLSSTQRAASVFKSIVLYGAFFVSLEVIAIISTVLLTFITVFSI